MKLTFFCVFLTALNQIHVSQSLCEKEKQLYSGEIVQQNQIITRDVKQGIITCIKCLNSSENTEQLEVINGGLNQSTITLKVKIPDCHLQIWIKNLTNQVPDNKNEPFSVSSTVENSTTQILLSFTSQQTSSADEDANEITTTTEIDISSTFSTNTSSSTTTSTSTASNTESPAFEDDIQTTTWSSRNAGFSLKFNPYFVTIVVMKLIFC